MQDILMNDEVKLDNTFKLSLMTDVAKGMEYLHRSHLHSHGNLKSSDAKGMEYLHKSHLHSHGNLKSSNAKGMEYLHKSHLHSHGNLKSSNCLVDGRWTVRVST